MRSRTAPAHPGGRENASATERLGPLLTPRSIALVGASPRPGTAGNAMVRELRRGRFAGPVYCVNPKYEEIERYPCVASLAALPETVEQVVLGVPNAALEAEVDAAIAHGASALTIFASGHLRDDTEPPLVERVTAKARAAGLPVCGGNAMGFYNHEAGVYVGCYPCSTRVRRGHIAFFTQSGSMIAPLSEADERLGFNLVVSTGQEITTTVADYIAYALERDSTRVIALFLETVRDPEGFMEALARAERRGVPVVVLKVGRTEHAAALAESHSGALAGDDAAHQAVFERFGAIRVRTVDEMANTCALLSQERPIGPGGFAAMLDSGGQRTMLVDLAAEVGVPFAGIGEATRHRLAARLDPGLEPVNPLDAWGTGRDAENVFADCLEVLMQDPGTAVGAFLTDRGEGGRFEDSYLRVVRRVAAATGKPLVLAAHRHGSGHDPRDLELVDEGIPVLEGDLPMLQAVRNAFEWRDRRSRTREMAAPTLPVEALRRWRRRLAAEPLPDEADTLALLADIGLPTSACREVTDAEAAVAAAERFGYPVVLKTAAPGVRHKSELGGVVAGLRDAGELRDAYRTLAACLGARALVQPMAPEGTELAMGIVVDPQFGPLVHVAAGGVLVEMLRDARFLLAPVDRDAARTAIEELRVAALLRGRRGRPRADLAAPAEALARLSRLAIELQDVIESLDVNPIIAGPGGCLAVDAAVVPARRAEE